MAGRPISRQQLKHIISLGEEGEETILSMLASGSTVKDVAEWLGFPRNSLYALYKWRDETPERQAAWRQALAHRSQSLAEESLEIADGAREDVDALRKAEMRIKVRQWLAGVSDPENYGKDKAAKLTINVATMHLTAVESVNRELQERAILKLRGGDPDALSPPAAIPDADYEVLDDTPEDIYADDPVEDDTDLRDLL